MTEQDQQKALAELDGFHQVLTPFKVGREVVDWAIFEREGKRASTKTNTLPNYLTSYDTIIPLMQKYHDEMRSNIVHELGNITGFKKVHQLFDATPSQLSEALLRATNKWKE